jgi:phosphoserine phosphatase
VELCAALLDVPPTQVVAMRPASEGGRLQPRLDGLSVYGEGKVRALRAAGAIGPLLAAFGDSAWDAALLREAEVPVAVHPSEELLRLSPELPGLLRLEGLG